MGFSLPVPARDSEGNLIIDYGLYGCRMRIVRVLGCPLTKEPLSLRQISCILYAFKDEICFGYRDRKYKSQAEFSRYFWRSGEIEDNLTTLMECALVDEADGKYSLTDLGKQAYAEIVKESVPK